MSIDFDYQKKVWGTAIPSTSPFSLAGLRFYYFLRSIRSIYGKVLEIGCGAGGNLQALRRYRPYLEMYGVDIGERAITKGSSLFPRLNLTIGTAENLPYADSFFDIVCFFDVLEHVKDPGVCLNEAFRVLKPQGIMHAYIPCEGELLSLHGILNRLHINLKKKTAGHIQQLTKEQVLVLCKKSGFDVFEVRWSCHYLNQVGDLLYYLYLSLSGKRLEESLEGSMEKNREIKMVFFSLVKSMVSFVWYWESRLLWWFPGAGIHITCGKP